MADEHQPRKPDAIRCPRDFPLARNDPRRDVMRNRIFGPILGVARVSSVELIDRRGESFIRKHPIDDVRDSLLFPVAHPREKQDRYLWLVAVKQADGTLVPGPPESGDAGEEGRIKFGYLVADEYADDPVVLEAVKTSWDERTAESLTSPEHLARLRELGIVPPEAEAELSPPAPVAPAPGPKPKARPKADPDATIPAAAEPKAEA